MNSFSGTDINIAVEWSITSEEQILLRSKQPDLVPLRWMELSHSIERCLAYVIIAGEEIASPLLKVPFESRVSLKVMPGLRKISRDGLRYELFFANATQQLPLISGSFINALMPDKAQTITVDISHLDSQTGQFLLRCDAGPEGHPDADWLAIIGFAIGRTDRIALLHSRSNKQWRVVNEIAHFDDVYAHKIYQGRSRAPHNKVTKTSECEEFAVLPLSPKESERVRKLQHNNLVAKGKELATQIAPNAGEDAYHYGSRLLGMLVATPPPDFAKRADERNGQITVLSICCGEAGIEANLFGPVMDRLNLVLLDINESLLEKATARFHDAMSCSTICGDVNNLPLLNKTFDIIVITSALHHIVELESFAETVRLMLKSDGEFWVIGENVGRTGSRLAPAAYEKANAIFHKIPARFRKNRSTGKIDSDIPNTDYSSACFEGIRSDELVSILHNSFSPFNAYFRNCFLWRLLDLAYVDNYNLNNPEDLDLVRELCISDWTYWCEGGLATELHGIYKRKDASSWVVNHS
jgi:hypothetical protein